MRVARLEAVERVGRQDAPIAIDEGECTFCGAEMRAGKCSQQCVLSRRLDQTRDSDRVVRTDSEES